MRTLLILLLLTAPLSAQSAVESSVLNGVRQMLSEQGRITFSDLHNSDRFSSEEKAFLGRLYEIFFAVPGFLKLEFESSGKVPTRGTMAAQFGISTGSVDLLLAVMEADPRVPPLYERDPGTLELSSLKLDNIDAFIEARGDQVKVTGWEGQAVPAFKVKTYEGETVTSSQLKGTNTLIYFWFTNCPPCKRIAPILKELQVEYGGDNFQILGMNADDVLGIGTSNESRIADAEKKGTPYRNANVNPATRSAFGSINVFPMLFFVNPGGTIVKHFVNFQDRATLEPIIQGLLK